MVSNINFSDSQLSTISKSYSRQESDKESETKALANFFTKASDQNTWKSGIWPSWRVRTILTTSPFSEKSGQYGHMLQASGTVRHGSFWSFDPLSLGSAFFDIGNPNDFFVQILLLLTQKDPNEIQTTQCAPAIFIWASWVFEHGTFHRLKQRLCALALELGIPRQAKEAMTRWCWLEDPGTGKSSSQEEVDRVVAQRSEMMCYRTG